MRRTIQSLTKPLGCMKSFKPPTALESQHEATSETWAFHPSSPTAATTKTNPLRQNVSPAENVTDIHTLAEFNELISKNPYVAVQAHAVWCGPCKAISPVYNKHAEVFANQGVTFARFDTDDVEDLAKELGIRSIPAFFFFENGEKSDSLTGANPSALEKHVKILAEKAGPVLSTNEDF
ncbi:Thioredoxin-like protein 1 [Cladobotryum mycophilum]|uniref:Thioredoxin-like protein 1 n=1 Tax=Cladobotryum mycophilum TaxID=491253 RepID=A0ABR0SRI1_9HYPO